MEKDNHKWHGAHHYSDKIHLAFILFLVFGIIVLLFSYFALNSDSLTKTPSPSIAPEISTIPEEDVVFCTQDVKECSDGSFVGRVGPNCEFSKCPE